MTNKHNFRNISAEELFEIQKKAILVRKKNSEERKKNKDVIRTFKDIARGLLEIKMIVFDKQTQRPQKDEKGNLLTINQKELLMARAIGEAVQKPNLKKIESLAKLLGEIEEKQENHFNLLLNDMKDQILEEENGS